MDHNPHWVYVQKCLQIIYPNSGTEKSLTGWMDKDDPAFNNMGIISLLREREITVGNLNYDKTTVHIAICIQ